MDQEILCHRKELIDEPTYEKYETVHREMFKVLTYNIWNHISCWQERIQSIIRIIKENSPDVACLLDANEFTWKAIVQALDKYYVIFQVFTEENEKSGSVLLCHRHTTEIPEGTQPYYYDFSAGGRIIGVELIVKVNNQKLHVLCTELDRNPDNDHVRSEQMSVVQQVLKPLKTFVLSGDFNTTTFREEAESKLGQLKAVDCWMRLGCPSKIKYTFDGKKNKCLRTKEQHRHTRIYCSPQLEIRTMSLVGTADTNTDVPVPPSCHYGLLSILELKK